MGPFRSPDVGASDESCRVIDDVFGEGAGGCEDKAHGYRTRDSANHGSPAVQARLAATARLKSCTTDNRKRSLAPLILASVCASVAQRLWQNERQWPHLCFAGDSCRMLVGGKCERRSARTTRRTQDTSFEERPAMRADALACVQRWVCRTRAVRLKPDATLLASRRRCGGSCRRSCCRHTSRRPRRR